MELDRDARTMLLLWRMQAAPQHPKVGDAVRLLLQTPTPVFSSAAIPAALLLLSCTGVLPAAQILDDLVRRGIRVNNDESANIAAILGSLSTLPAAQQVPLEVYGCLLQRSACMAYLFSALLKFAHAQQITPTMLCKVLVAAARSDRHLLLPPLLR